MKRRFDDSREDRELELAEAYAKDAAISEAVEDTMEHCSICGLPMGTDDEHLFCTAIMNTKFQPPF